MRHRIIKAHSPIRLFRLQETLPFGIIGITVYQDADLINKMEAPLDDNGAKPKRLYGESNISLNTRIVPQSIPLDIRSLNFGTWVRPRHRCFA